MNNDRSGYPYKNDDSD